jgi:tol-pal system-associated acyl-CoA thioesterase
VRTKVYYGDTDAGGVVYYANYLRWLEMARWEFMDELGFSVDDFARQGVIFAVARLEIDYRASAQLGDEVEIQTEIQRVRRVRFTLRQRVLRVSDGEDLVDASVMLACVDPSGKLRALPESLDEKLDSRKG